MIQSVFTINKSIYSIFIYIYKYIFMKDMYNVQLFIYNLQYLLAKSQKSLLHLLQKRSSLAPTSPPQMSPKERWSCASNFANFRAMTWEVRAQESMC